MSAWRRATPVLVCAAAWIAADQATKSLMRRLLGIGDIVSMLGGTVVLRPTYNRGAFLSLGASMSGAARDAVFVYGAGVLLIVLLVWAARTARLLRWEALGAAAILGGGLSNLIDRVLQDGRVFDFLNLGLGSLRTGIFNVADVGIMAGAALLCTARWIAPPQATGA
ncbi:MAG: signal peptidase II [Proteobacteria bacterium]|nr:signal peptidase II [Pseudomonadota bacterium]